MSPMVRARSEPPHPKLTVDDGSGLGLRADSANGEGGWLADVGSVPVVKAGLRHDRLVLIRLPIETCPPLLRLRTMRRQASDGFW
jgi:hypothetical protein